MIVIALLVAFLAGVLVTIAAVAVYVSAPTTTTAAAAVPSTPTTTAVEPAKIVVKPSLPMKPQSAGWRRNVRTWETRQQSSIDDFIRERCRFERDHKMLSADLYAYYSHWCWERGRKRVAHNTFSVAIRNYEGVYLAKLYHMDLRQHRMVIGLAPTTTFERPYKMIEFTAVKDDANISTKDHDAFNPVKSDP
jgi:hypothetical protein